MRSATRRNAETVLLMKIPRIACATLIIFFLSPLWLSPLQGAIPYKTYVIRPYKGRDILCDRYTVQKGDFVWELLRHRGEIAEEDFPRFVSILRHINSHIEDLDKIYPGQEILIPLKEMISGQEAAPAPRHFLTIPVIPDILYTTYTVQPGDYLYRIVAVHHGIEVDEIPEAYVAALKEANPDVKDLNRIYPGQQIRIPEAGPNESAPETPPSVESPPAEPPLEVEATALSEQPVDEIPGSPLARILKRLGGNVAASGTYFFPVDNGQDFELDLSVFPVVELPDGRRVLLETGKALPRGADQILGSFWKGLTVVQTNPGGDERTVLEKIFRILYGEKVSRTVEMPVFEDGIQVTLRGDWIFPQDDPATGTRGYHCITLIQEPKERTPAALRAYFMGKQVRISDVPAMAEVSLEMEGEDNPGTEPDGPLSHRIPDAADQVAFVAAFARAIGYSYDRHVPLTFRYAGIQVHTMTDLLHGRDGTNAVVDFGTLYGESRSAIEATGLRVICIKPEDRALEIARNVLTTAGLSVTEQPVFFGADRNVFKTVSLAVPGLLTLRSDEERILLTDAPLGPDIIRFLAEKDIMVLQIEKGTT